jgi:hypothetical protein
VTARLIRALIVLALIALSAPARGQVGDPGTPASPWHTCCWQAEAWYFHQNGPDQSQARRATLRFYQPFFFDNGWQFTLREDIRAAHTNAVGIDNPNGAWATHLGDMFVQGVLKTPPITPGLHVSLGLRSVFPTGDLPPFGTGRHAMGPLFGLNWDVPGAGGTVTLAPLVSYLHSFGGQPQHSVATNELALHPIIQLKPLAGLAISFWREHPILLNADTGRWFVPFDVMVSYTILPHLSVGAGVAVALRAGTGPYDNIVYGRLAYTY